MPKTISTDRARQGPKGRQVLYVLVSALILAAIAWAGVEFFGQAIETPATDQTTVPVN